MESNPRKILPLIISIFLILLILSLGGYFIFKWLESKKSPESIIDFSSAPATFYGKQLTTVTAGNRGQSPPNLFLIQSGLIRLE